MRPKRWVPFAIVAALFGLAAIMGVTASAGTAAAGPKKMDQALLKKLKDSARGSVTVASKKSTGFAAFLGAGRNGDLLPGKSGSAPGKAKDFIAEYGGLLGVGNANSDLVQTDVSTDTIGATHVTYEQRYNGLPVFGGEIKAHVDEAGNLTAVNGVIVPAIEIDTNARLSSDEAAAKAIAAVVADPPVSGEGVTAKVSAGDLRATSSVRLVYRTGLIRGKEGTNLLAYQVEVTNGSSVREVLFVHADNGKVVNRWSMVHDALDRRVYERFFTPAALVWSEGDPFPGALNAGQQDLVNFSEDSYNLFFNTFGRDSFDGAGGIMHTRQQPADSCPNASWNGTFTSYCAGVTSDDVVSHEWGHAYTEFTHDLIYQWQPGALNESYSDIWGETLDMINGAGTDSPAPMRTVGACSTFTRRSRRRDQLAGIDRPHVPRGDAPLRPADDTGPGITGDIVLAERRGGRPLDLERVHSFVNAAAVAGKIALVDRGICGFAIKVKIAQDAGAIGVVVANNVEAVAGMGGADPHDHDPVVDDRAVERAMRSRQRARHGPVNVTMKPGSCPRGRRLLPLADGRRLDGVRRCDPRHVERRPASATRAR